MRGFSMLAAVWASQALAADFNIVDYGAKGDNYTLNTVAIQSAISAAVAAGGGIVVVPPGVFRTATISLASNVYLYIQSCGSLEGSAVLADYVAVNGGEWGMWDVLHTKNATNTGVYGDFGGNGTLSGPMWQMIASYDPVNNQLQPQTWAGQHGCLGECRPRLVVFEDCVNVTMQSIRLVDSADWTQLYRRVRGVSLLNMYVWGSQQWANNDSVDFESCSDVLVQNYTSFTGDDGIVLASGNTNNLQHPWPEAPGEYSPTTRVRILNATLSSYSSGIKWEGIFQPWHGDITDVFIQDVVIHDSARGLGWQQRTGYGVWRDVVLERVSVLRTHGIMGPNWWAEGEALWMTSVPESSTLVSPLGGIHNVTLRDCVLQGEQGALIISRDQGNATGAMQGPGISGITLQNVTVIVGVYGNATRPGVHDFRPVDPGAASPQSLQANVTGWWMEHAGPVTVQGGSVLFNASQAQPFWTPGTCIQYTADSQVSQAGLACTPAPE